MQERNWDPSKLVGAKYVQLDNGFRVWTKRVGTGPVKILTLHGGPGCTHEYFECLEEQFPADSFQIIYYDQLGSYYSDQPNDPSLWTVERFCDEVEQVRQALGLEQFYLYGQSWGGVLAIEYALKHPQQLKGIILSNVTASIESYLSHLNQLRAALPQPLQDRLRFHEERQDFHNPEYERILFEQIRSHYLCRLSPWPEPLLRTFAHQNHQVSQTIYGPTTYLITGNFRNWNRWNDLHKISVPTLVICGRYDTMDPHDAERMGALIPRSQVKICENGSHCTLYDDPDTYFRALHAFISTVEERVINPDDAVPAR